MIKETEISTTPNQTSERVVSTSYSNDETNSLRPKQLKEFIGHVIAVFVPELGDGMIPVTVGFLGFGECLLVSVSHQHLTHDAYLRI